MNNGICLVATGAKAQTEAELCIQSIRKVNKHLPITVFVDSPTGFVGLKDETVTYNVSLFPDKNNKQASRILKTSLDMNTPYKHTLYMDVDCRLVAAPDMYFEALADGFDFVICPSSVQGDKWGSGHSEDERELTLNLLGHQPLQMQCGVYSFRRTKQVRAFFAEWRREYQRYNDLDQLAFTRALYTKPMRVQVLDGRVWNNGSVIQHYFGRLRD